MTIDGFLRWISSILRPSPSNLPPLFSLLRTLFRFWATGLEKCGGWKKWHIWMGKDIRKHEVGAKFWYDYHFLPFSLSICPVRITSKNVKSHKKKLNNGTDLHWTHIFDDCKASISNKWVWRPNCVWFCRYDTRSCLRTSIVILCKMRKIEQIARRMCFFSVGENKCPHLLGHFPLSPF